MKKTVLTLLLALAATAPARAETAREMIEDFFAGLDTLAADFTQTVTDDSGRVLEESSGRVYLELPQHFRWDYAEPYRQHIVADGDKVWLYDVELEQVTVRDQQEAAKDSPMMVLADTTLMDEHFVSENLGLKDGYRWLRLTPRDQESEFEAVEAAIDESGLRCLVFRDRFGQETELVFKNAVINQPLDTGIFRFVPPDGVDVIGDMPQVQTEPLE